MAKYTRKFCFEILTPEATAYTADAVSAVLPAVDGEIGILGGHAPLIAMIGAGRLKVQDDRGQERNFFVAGGFAHVRDNAVSVLTDQCAPLESLQSAEATTDLDAANKLPADNEESRTRRSEAISAAKAKLRLAKAEASRREG